MSARQRALEYAAQVANQKKTRRTAQPNVFGKATSSSAPAFQEQQREPATDIADATSTLRTQEKEIADNEEEDVVDSKDFGPGPQTGKAPTRAKTTVTAAAPSGLKTAFAKCWTIVDDIDIPAVQHDEKSWYIPSCVSTFEVLSNMEEILSGNEELRWISPHYFSLPVRVYYAVIFYVQTLRAKEQAGTLTKSEGSWLRAFFRRYKDTMCPIAGPLVPIFSNIVACLPDDDQFEYVYPSIPKTGTYSVVQSGSGHTSSRSTTVLSTHFLFPSVPMVASLLRTFCTSSALGKHQFDDSDQFVPFKIEEGGDFAGVSFPSHKYKDENPITASLLCNPALSHPLPESKERLKEIHGFWKRSKAKNIPYIPMNLAYDPTGPADQTLMSDDFDWFQPCVDMANVQVKFFSDSINLSGIPTVGGMSSTVMSTLYFSNNKDKPTVIEEWYPDVFSSTKARFKATASDLPLDHKYAAAYALTNSVYEWKSELSSRIGTIKSEHRKGPYFENTKVTYQLEHEVPVMTGIYTMLQTQFYDAHGKA
jgi:hypothetical protein